jgi:SAM-dependent methyltransferase
MTDEERGKATDAEEAVPQVPSSSPPPPPDVSMLDEALAPLDLSDLVSTEERVREKASSTPDRFEVGRETDDGEEAVPLFDRRSAPDLPRFEQEDEAEQERSDRGSVPDSEWASGPGSARRPRVTLKIPDDDVPLSSNPPPVEESVPDKLVGPAAVVHAMRIIAIGETQPAPKEDAEELVPEDQLDMEPLGHLDVQSTWTPPPAAIDALPGTAEGKEVSEPDDGSADQQLMSEEIEPLEDVAEASATDSASLEAEEEIEPEVDDDEEDVLTPPPVTVIDRPARAESPSPPITAPLSPSASAPPPPVKAPVAGADLPPVPLSLEQLRLDATPAQVPEERDEPSALELEEDEVAPISKQDPDVEDAPDLPPLPAPPARAVVVRPAAEALSPAPAVAVAPPPPVDVTTSAEGVKERIEAPAPPKERVETPAPAPTRPKAPPPPKKNRPADAERRNRRARPGWEEVFSDEFVRAYPRLNSNQVDAEVSFIEKSLSIQRGGVVLDLGCGSGQHAVELASRGYNVVGYDLSLTMLAMAADEAQERGQKINFLQGDMREMAFEEMFDGVFSWSTSFGFFDEEKNVSVIQRVHRSLRQGGMFLLDLVNRDYICSRLPSLSWFEGDGCVCIDDAQFNSITSRLRVKRTIMIEDGTSREAEYSVRLYSLHEIGKILHESGFKVVEVSGHPASVGAFFDAESPRVITLAVRR